MNEVMPRENLIRASHDDGSLEVTRDDSGGMPILHGHAAVFNQWTEINSVYEGRFLERMMPGAFAKTISEGRDRIKVLFQHGKDPQIGDKPLGPLRSIEEDAYGLRYEVPLLDTAYNRELIPGLDAGLYGASFRFSVMQENFNKKPPKSSYNPLGLPERSVTEARMPELGPVTFGAYANATSGLRSMTDDFLVDHLLADDELRERVRAMSKKPRTNTVSVSFNGVELTDGARIVTPKAEERADWSTIQILSEMNNLGSSFIDLEAAAAGVDADEADDIKTMQGILAQIDALVQAEAAEPDDGGRAAETDKFNRADEPEPPEATTRPEPEPSEATTPSTSRSLFWLTDPPNHLKGSK